jgi:cytochrome c-type biogenesis protein CcmH/NrfG
VHYHAALCLDPYHSAIWVQFGHALKEQGKVHAAESAYRKSLLLDDHNADTYLQLGHALKIQGSQAEAEDAYLDALFYDPDCLPARHELAAFGHSTAIIRDALQHRYASSPRTQSPVSSGS